MSKPVRREFDTLDTGGKISGGFTQIMNMARTEAMIYTGEMMKKFSDFLKGIFLTLNSHSLTSKKRVWQTFQNRYLKKLSFL